MNMKLIDENKTEVMISNSKEKFIVEQLKFIGAVPTKETSRNTYFVFNGDIRTTAKYLGW